MKIRCNWCDNWISETDETCPHCGGVNAGFKRQAVGVPQTMEELKAWAGKHGLPLAQMRTYIGEDYTGARAFGIYKDGATGNFIVYKNRADGTRVIRYEGPDEAYAVNELYQKMKERVSIQKGRQAVPAATKSPAPPKRRNRFGSVVKWMLISWVVSMAFAVIMNVIPLLIFGMMGRGPSTGYYHYGNEMYYWQGTTDSWYIYDGTGWDSYHGDLDYLYDNYDDYRVPSYSYDDYGVTDFKESDCYVESSSHDDDSKWDSDWDDDYDWDGGYDWDDSYDDWDSDW